VWGSVPGASPIFCRRWPGQGWPVVILHGAWQESADYAGVAERLSGWGLDVWVPDLRGFGRSPGHRCHIGSFEEYRRDLVALLAAVGRARGGGTAPGTPATRVTALGHSMGALLALDLALAVPDGVAAVVASAPLLQFAPGAGPRPWERMALRWLGKLMPTYTVRRHPGRSGDLRNEPRTMTLRWSAELLRLQARVRRGLTQLRCPVLFLCGQKDRLADFRPLVRQVESARSSTWSLRLLPRQGHELLTGSERESTLREVEDWLVSLGLLPGAHRRAVSTPAP